MKILKFVGKLRGVLVLAAWLSAGTLLHGQTVKDREGAVRKDKATLENDERWIYNDYRAALEQGKETGKPVMVVLRCVPCLACAGFDGEILRERTELTPLLDQFVCVRVINANDLDLSLFQFDYDLSFSTLFFNGDGTLYGRFGSWTHQEDTNNKATNSMKEALQAVLSLHKDYPNNKEALAGKQSKPLPYRTPVAIPALSGKYDAQLNWNGAVVKSCVHCHQIGDAMRLEFRNKQQPIPDEWLFPFPQPEAIGLHLAEDSRARVESVAPGSIAESAKLRRGDEIVTLAGQPLISIADFSWVLHQSGDTDTLAMEVVRSGKKGTLQLELTDGWRRNPDHTKRVGTWPMRGMALGGMRLADLDEKDRSRYRMEDDRLALKVLSVGKYGMHGAAKRIGFQPDDVIVRADGQENRMTEKQLIAYLMQNHNRGKKVDLTVLRNRKEVTLQLPMQ
tara:strand:- start:7916 stop:9265 length:1350 start_codon:yes stop_codon:yes gene_type:complete